MLGFGMEHFGDIHFTSPYLSMVNIPYLYNKCVEAF